MHFSLFIKVILSCSRSQATFLRRAKFSDSFLATFPRVSHFKFRGDEEAAKIPCFTKLFLVLFDKTLSRLCGFCYGFHVLSLRKFHLNVTQLTLIEPMEKFLVYFTIFCVLKAKRLKINR